MKKLVISLTLITFFLTSCEIDDYGEMHVSGFGWFVIIALIAVFIIAVIQGNKQQKETTQKMTKQGLDYTQFTFIGNYVGGHPSIDSNKNDVYVRKNIGMLMLYQIPIANVSMPSLILNAEIPADSISDITVEDASSIESKVTLGRVILVGVFALAWRKKKKNELAFIVINWKKGRFEHSTTFSFEGQNAMQNANTARNRLIGLCD